METVQSLATSFLNTSFGSGSRLWPLYLIATLVIGFALFRIRHVNGSFLQWLLPRSVWTHASHVVDIKLFFTTRLISIISPFQTVAVGAVMTTFVISLFPADGLSSGTMHPVMVSVLLLVVGDFATYWVHRIHHEMRVLWPFHSVHHSAEVMTPITVYRKHPLYDLSKVVIHGSVLGVLQGILLGAFQAKVGMSMLLGVNSAYFIFNMLGANFRHSHIWISYGPLLEHILISPAQHQIHHSIAPEHHNTNYGEVLALWDWIFGTLYIADQPQEIAFGLGDAHGNRLRQPHDSLTAALVVPVKDSLKQVKKQFLRARPGTEKPITPAE